MADRNQPDPGIALHPARFPRQAALHWRLLFGRGKKPKPADAASSPLMGMSPCRGGWQV